MKYRTLGKTGVSISEIGFGAWGIGGSTEGATSYGRTSDEVSCNALEVAYEKGINFFDTSNVYGNGHSEELIGSVFLGKRDKVFIATKVGLSRFHEPPNFEPKYIRESLKNSLKRLKTDYIDLLQLHNPELDQMEICSAAIQCLEELKYEGLIHAFGLSLKSPESGIKAIKEFNLDVLQINFNMLDLRAVSSGLFSLAKKNNIGIIARTPLCFGFLSDDLDESTIFPNDDHRSLWSREQVSRWCKAREKINSEITLLEHQSLTDLALRFCLSFDEVSVTIPGMLSSTEVRKNIKASDYGRLSYKELNIISDIYNQDTLNLLNPNVT